MTILNFQRNSAVAPRTPARRVQGGRGVLRLRGTLAAQLPDTLRDDRVLIAVGGQQIERGAPGD
jgi:hypothetical protein